MQNTRIGGQLLPSHRVVLANRPRRGVTLIELLAVVTIIGVLIALLLPAVHKAREAARRAHCASQMKNLGVAIQLHADSQNAFPSGIEMRRPLGASYLLQILPYMEQRPLYDSINMDGVTLLITANATALAHTPEVFLCPSDSGRSTPGARNAASSAGNFGRPVFRDEGVFIGRRLTAREIQDGLSLTAGVTEWIVGPDAVIPSTAPSARDRLASKHRLRRVFTDTPGDLEAFTRACQALNPADIEVLVVNPSKGHFWLEGNLAYTLYNHTLPPNQPSCSASQNMDATTAGSFHGSGAHVLTMDGGVHFVKGSIDPRVWSALGSRSGGEALGGGLFE